MKQRGCKTVVAIDVGGRSNEEELNYGSSASTWWLFFQRCNPRNSKTVISTENIISHHIIASQHIIPSHDITTTPYHITVSYLIASHIIQ